MNYQNEEIIYWRDVFIFDDKHILLLNRDNEVRTAMNQVKTF